MTHNVDYVIHVATTNGKRSFVAQYVNSGIASNAAHPVGWHLRQLGAQMSLLLATVSGRCPPANFCAYTQMASFAATFELARGGEDNPEELLELGCSD